MVDQKKWRVALANKNLRQWQLAQRLGIRPEELSRLFNGWRPFPETLKKPISKILGISKNKLFKERRG